MYKNLRIEKVFNNPESKFMVYGDICQKIRIIKGEETVHENEIVQKNKPISGFLIESSAKRFIQMEEEKNEQEKARLQKAGRNHDDDQA